MRQICRRAGVNVAAVNYHFRDKQQLYAEVLRYAHRYATQKYPVNGGVGPDSPAEERLAAFIRSFLYRLTDSGRPAWHGKLMLRELSEPTAALDEVVEESIRPSYGLLRSIVAELMGPQADPREVGLCSASIVGQCMHFEVAREVLTRLVPGLAYDPATIEGIYEHVLRFSLSAIRCLGQSNT